MQSEGTRRRGTNKMRICSFHPHNYQSKGNDGRRWPHNGHMFCNAYILKALLNMKRHRKGYLFYMANSTVFVLHKQDHIIVLFTQVMLWILFSLILLLFNFFGLAILFFIQFLMLNLRIRVLFGHSLSNHCSLLPLGFCVI